jgi:hypothetical protein
MGAIIGEKVLKIMVVLRWDGMGGLYAVNSDTHLEARVGEN